VSLLRPGASHRGANAHGVRRLDAADLSKPSLVDVHPHAEAAAEIAEAVGEQGKFWEIHDTIYENQHDLSDAALLGYVEQVGADVDKVKSDIADGGPRQRVEADFEGAIRSGANGTPTFFVNGLRYDGSWLYEPFFEYLTQVLES